MLHGRKAPPTSPRQSQGLCRQRPKEPKTHRAETRRRWPARNHREQHDRRERHRRCCTAVRPHRRRRDKARGYADKDQKSQRPTERKLGVAGSPRTIVDSTMHEEHSSRDRCAISSCDAELIAVSASRGGPSAGRPCSEQICSQSSVQPSGSWKLRA